MPGHKIATCSYCGTRAALVLHEGRHELACSACGAPLHDLKNLKSDKVRHDNAPRARKTWDGPEMPMARLAKVEGRKKKKKKKKKSLAYRLFDEAFDVIDDIFD